MKRRSNNGTARQYPRTARLNELLREILGEELERLDDERLEMVTITSVDIEGDLRKAFVFYDSLQGEDGDEEILVALGELRWRLQSAIGRQARIKHTPELVFAPDLAVRTGARIESLLAELPEPTAQADEGDVGDVGVAGDRPS
jgi:ribosome-binding factor A